MDDDGDGDDLDNVVDDEIHFDAVDDDVDVDEIDVGIDDDDDGIDDDDDVVVVVNCIVGHHQWDEEPQE